jgi:hypothetical protein
VVVVEETAEVGCGRHVDNTCLSPVSRLVSSVGVAFPSLVLAARPSRGKPTIAFVRLVPRALKAQRDTLAEVIAATRGCSSR